LVFKFMLYKSISTKGGGFLSLKRLYIHVHTTSIGLTNQCSHTLANRAICIVSRHPSPANPSFTLLLLSVHQICIVTLTISTCT
jgi:hypothetical protein